MVEMMFRHEFGFEEVGKRQNEVLRWCPRSAASMVVANVSRMLSTDPLRRKMWRVALTCTISGWER